MFAKIALRNVKSQLGNYLVYFTTVALTIALLFSFCNLIFSEALQEAIENMRDIAGAMTGITVFVCVVTAFVLAYAAVYMLGLRKKEFGTYLTLGMKRRDILKLFALETLFISLVAAAMGLVAGLFVYQGLSALLCKLLEAQVQFSSYSPKGLLLTLILTIAMFAFSLLVSSRYLKKVTIHELLLGEKHERETKHTVLWGALAALALGGIGASFYLEYRAFTRSILYDEGVAVLPPLAVLCACIFIFYVSFSKGIGAILLKNKKLCAKGTNVFVFRQLSSKMSVNAVMFGLLGLLLSFTVMGTNLCYTEKISKEHFLDHETPFDVSARFSENRYHGISVDEGEKIIEKYSPIASKTPYGLYSSGRNEIGKGLSYTEDYENDSYMPLSQFNALLALVDYEPLELEDGYYVISAFTGAATGSYENISVSFGGKNYSYKGCGTEYPLFIYTLCYIVIPDEAIEYMTAETKCYAYELTNEHYDAYTMSKELIWHDEDGDENSDYVLREYARLTSDAQVGALIVGAMYVAVVFICMALAILSMKTLSTVREDRVRFNTLSRLGASKKEMKRALFRVNFFCFALPFSLPFAFCIPTGAMLGKLFSLLGMHALGTDILIASVGIALIMLAVYTLYFIVTYRISCDNIIPAASHSVHTEARY